MDIFAILRRLRRRKNHLGRRYPNNAYKPDLGPIWKFQTLIGDTEPGSKAFRKFYLNAEHPYRAVLRWEILSTNIQKLQEKDRSP